MDDAPDPRQESMTPGENLDAVAGELSGYRFSYGTEADLQAAVADILAVRWTVVFEYPLEGGRIDLYLPDVRVGVECKTQGSAAETARQCARYLASTDLDSLLLVTRRVRYRDPARRGGRWCGGKPFAVVSLARDAL